MEYGESADLYVPQLSIILESFLCIDVDRKLKDFIQFILFFDGGARDGGGGSGMGCGALVN